MKVNMKTFQHMSIRRKIVLLQLLTSFIVLLLISILGYNFFMSTYEESVKRSLQSTTSIIEYSSIPAIQFMDKNAATSILTSLKAEKDIINSRIFDSEGKLFASYDKNKDFTYKFTALTDAYIVENGYQILSKKIMVENEVIGMIVLRNKMSDYQLFRIQYVLISAFVFLIGMIIAYFLSFLTKKTISSPIEHLVDIFNKVADTGNYSIRVDVSRDDEIGILYKSFNDTMYQIGVRESAKQKAEAASETKSIFLANMSHEIRTPMNAILGFAHLALKTDLNNTQLDYIKKIEKATQGLLKIIVNILDFSKIETNKLSLDVCDFNLNNVFKNISLDNSAKAQSKGLQIEFSIAQDLPLNLIGDVAKLEQVLTNLTDNAIKFTESGKVVISAKLAEMIDRNIKIEFSIKDSGIGLVEEQISGLFKSFTQGDGSSTRKFGGLGLGLVISQKLVSLMGGEITVESQLNKGSKFTFILNFALSDQVSIQEVNEDISVDIPTIMPLEAPRQQVVEVDKEQILLLLERLVKLLAEDDFDSIKMIDDIINLSGEFSILELNEIKQVVEDYDYEKALELTNNLISKL